MPGYWKQTSLRLEVECWDRLRLFAAATGSTTSDVAVDAIEWATEKHREGKWNEIERRGRRGLSKGFHSTALRLSPELKENLRTSSADARVNMMSFMGTAIWAYTSGVDAAAESKFRESVRRVVAERAHERQAHATELLPAPPGDGEAVEN